MRISHITVNLDVRDLNELIEDLAPDSKLIIQDIKPDGIHGHLKLLWWTVDFVARPSMEGANTVTLEIGAHKLVPIPGMIVERQLREAVKDAPPGVSVLQQTLKVHVPSLLQALGMSVQMEEFHCQEGFVRIAISDFRIPALGGILNRPDSIGPGRKR